MRVKTRGALRRQRRAEVGLRSAAYAFVRCPVDDDVNDTAGQSANKRLLAAAVRYAEALGYRKGGPNGEV